ncbi:MAG: alginate O-acetyltransferase AlgF [Trueperaceae bacterium]
MPRAIGIGSSYWTVEDRPERWTVRPFAIFLIALLLMFGPAPSSAQGGLYGPEAPRNTSYVRIINASDGEPIAPTVAGSGWEPLPFAQVSRYRQVPPGDHSALIGGQELSLTTQPESFTTLVVLPDRILVLADTPLRDISRGLLTLYNLTSEALTVQTSDGTEVLSAVSPDSASSVTISEAEVELAVYRGDEPLTTLERRLYRRGEAHSVIVLPTGSDPQIIYDQAGAER